MTSLIYRAGMVAADDLTKSEPEVRVPQIHALRKKFAPGLRIAHYELIRSLGKGGMGDVYLAWDMRLGRRVALKFLLQVNAQHAARFFVEARATARLAHENIVALHDIGDHDGCPYMVLEYVPGKTLSAWLAERRDDDQWHGVPAVRAAKMMLPVARAVQNAQEAGIVHRDLKPANIMLGENGTVKVLDFGVAKLVGDATEEGGDARSATPEEWAKQAANARDLTETGALVGTRAYMAPEQWWGEEIDGRVDIWAIGIILYHYAGLAAFQERHAAYFFGRETLIEQILARLGEEPFLALGGWDAPTGWSADNKAANAKAKQRMNAFVARQPC